LKPELLTILVCPACRGELSLADEALERGEIVSGRLACTACGLDYPIIRFVPRFVATENYAQSFGLQWNRYPRTQLDSHSGLPITRDRFFAQSGWNPEEMAGQRILDVGCGSGRFAEVALATGAHVVALDYSAAVDAARANLGDRPGIDIVQGDIYALPFRDSVFDAVYCFGVLQHTPDVKRAFMSLLPPLKHGARIAVDVYPRLLSNVLWPKYWFRPFTKRMDRERLLAIVEKLVKYTLPISRVIGRIPVIGKKLRYFVPIANYEGTYPLDETQLREWSVLDTFDMFSPAHDHPQSAATMRAWLAEAGLARPEVLRTGHLVARGIKQ
jgi:SAM-dependent methyltransferase